MNGKLYWLSWHKTILCWLTDAAYAARVEKIKKTKPANQIEQRLTELCVVKGKLPTPIRKACKKYFKAWDAWYKARVAYDKALYKAREALYKAREALDKAWYAWDKAWEALDKAQKARDKIFTKFKSEIEALHKLECPDSKWNGTEIVFEK